MNRLPEVKKFIFADLPLFHNARFKSKPGAPPKLMLLNKAEEAVETIDLEKFNREECNELLLSKGFFKKESETDQVPDEYKEGPYKPKQEL